MDKTFNNVQLSSDIIQNLKPSIESSKSLLANAIDIGLSFGVELEPPIPEDKAKNIIAEVLKN